jgi:glucose-1-phosphatase
MMLNKEIQALIFDMGGVLLRTTNDQPRNELATELNIDPKALENLVFNSPSSISCESGIITYQQNCEILTEQLGNALKQNTEVFLNRFFAGDVENDELIKLITKIKSKYSLGLLSNAWEGARERLVGKHQFFGLFDCVLFSAEAGFRKPDPQIYLKILEKMNVEPTTAVFIDDMPQNIIGAKSVGMIAVQFTSNHQIKADLSRILDIDFLTVEKLM